MCAVWGVRNSSLYVWKIVFDVLLEVWTSQESRFSSEVLFWINYVIARLQVDMIEPNLSNWLFSCRFAMAGKCCANWAVYMM